MITGFPACLLSVPTGDVGCVAVPKTCNSGPGSPCCPSTYPLATNANTGKSSCGDNEYCDIDPKAPTYPGIELLLSINQANRGFCRANAPDCGKFGKPCCVSNSGRTSAFSCETSNTAQKGYCADAAGRTSSTGAKYSELMCTRCPAKLDVTAEQNYHKYWSCTA